MGVKTKRKERTEGSITLLKYVKSLFISLIITFASIIIFALIIKWFSLGDEIISPVNLIIKALSVIVGVLVLCKNENKLFIKGFCFSFLYTFVSFVIFSLLAGTFIVGLNLVVDFLFNIVIGVLAGFLASLRKKG